MTESRTSKTETLLAELRAVIASQYTRVGEEPRFILITREQVQAAIDEIERLRTTPETNGEVARLHETFQEIMALLADMLDADDFNNIEQRVLDAGVPYPPEKTSGLPVVMPDSILTRAEALPGQ